MLVHHVCYYLTDWNGIKPRQEDYDTSKIVKCLKGDAVKGYFDITVNKVRLHVEEANKNQFLAQLWIGFGKLLADRLTSPAALVPVPNHDAIVGFAGTYRTLTYARAIAAASVGKVQAYDLLRWADADAAAHTRKGARYPLQRYENMRVVGEVPKIPIILFDDVITSGSSFIGAYWRLQEAGNAPIEGLVVARRTVIQEEKMVGTEQRDLEIPPKPMF